MEKKNTAESEEYLETMARMEEKKESPTVSALAQELDVSKASVSEMLKKMAGRGLVKYSRYAHPSLTRKGKQAGKGVLKKHRVIHRFLELIGIRKSEVHKEACELEHAISNDVEKRIESIVTRHGKIPLTDLSKGMKGRIAGIETDAKTAQRLRDMGLTENAEITLTQSAPFKGPLELSVRGTRLAVGRRLALKILVKG